MQKHVTGLERGKTLVTNSPLMLGFQMIGWISDACFT